MEPNPKEIKGSYDTKETHHQNYFYIQMKILCKTCGGEITIKYKTKKARNFCSNYCGVKWYRNLHKISERAKSLGEVSEFLKEMELKRHWAEMGDIFKMIHIWDIIEPRAQIEDYDNGDKELTFSKIYLRIIEWKIKTEKLLEKEKNEFGDLIYKNKKEDELPKIKSTGNKNCC